MSAYHVPAEIILAAQRGDAAALQSILSTYERPLRTLINRKVGLRFHDRVDDLVQEINLRLVAHITDFDFGRRVQFTTWVYSLAKNLCIDELKKRRIPAHSMVLVGEDGDEERDTPDREAPQPDARVIRKEFRRQLFDSLRRLPRELTRIFYLHEVGELDFRDIARSLHQPLGTVKSKYYRALGQLQFWLRHHQPAA